jgi:3D (Asp-Asp-Asp) domain-containing protein
MVATAYNGRESTNGPWGGVSAWTGQPLQPGDVAVDPTVIPLGTALHVQGYGPALVDDTGSAIVGDRIDLFFDEPSAQVARYGVHVVRDLDAALEDVDGAR